MAFEILAFDINEPELCEEAIHSKEHNFWRKAMNSEINSLKENNMWILEPLPQNCHHLQMKKNPDGTIEKCKVQLMIKGFNQKQGINYNQTFNSITKLYGQC